MDLNKLYSLTNKENISLFNARIKNKAIVCDIEEKYYIGLNYSKFNNSIQEKEVLAEELGHYYCNALYNISSDATTVRKKENRAKKWAFTTLVPASSILKLQEEGCQYSYEFAEKLEVSEELVNTAYNYYIENNYIQ